MGTWERSDQVWEETIMRFSLLPLATIVSPLLGQLKFNGGVSSSSSSNGNSPSSNRNTSRPSSGVTDVDEKLFFGGDTPSLTGNQALDGWVWVPWVQPFSAQPSKVPSMGPSRARVTPVEEERGKLLARMSLAQGSLVDSLVELPTVATAVTTPSPSTTMASTATSRTRASTTRASTTPASTTKAPTSRTRASTTPAPTARTDASVTTARPSVTRMA